MLLALTALFASGCSRPSAARTHAQSAPPTAYHLQIDGDASARLSALRARIDAAGADPDCAQLEPPIGDSAWLAAWCGLRAGDWALSAQQAHAAQTNLAPHNSLRRQIELLLIEAIARQETAAARQNIQTSPSAPPDAHAVSLATRAHHLWLNARIPMHGNLRDPNAGDLANLYAMALERGLLHDAKDPDGRPLRRGALLDIARSEYRDFGRLGALSQTLRASFDFAVERGQLDQAIEMLERAFALDIASENPRALARDLARFERLNRLLGQVDAPPKQAGTQGPARTIAGQVTNSHIEHLLATPAGRRRLADAIAWTRASPTRTIAASPLLIDALRAHGDFDDWHGEDWRLGFEGGQLLAEHGQLTPAKRYFQAAIGAIEEMRGRLPTPALRQEFFADKRKVYMALVDAYIGLDTTQRTQANYQRSLVLANALKARGLLDLLDGDVDPALATEPRPNTRHSTHLRPGRAGSKHARAASALAQLEDWSRAQRSNLSHRAAQTAQSKRSPNTLARQVGAQLAPNTVLLEYLIMPRRSYLWVISDQGIKMRQLAGREDIAPLVDAFIRTLGERPDPARQRALAERQYVELIGPAQDLLKSADQLIIAPDGKLYDLPFEMLARPTRSAEPDYLMRDQVVTYTPSSAVFERLMARKAAAQPDSSTTRTLLIGDANLDRAAIDLLKLATNLPDSGMFSLGDVFPKLPGARAELDAINTRLGARDFEVEMRVGEMAAESWMRNADLTQYGIIHVAAHGISDARSLQVASVQSGLEFNQPALLLSRDPEQPDDGIVTLGELLSRRTAAEMVVLSGCTTGRGWQTLGAGAFGLAGAILYTGSSSVVASMWSVEDADTSKLMAAFYRGIADGKTPAQALQSGQVAMSKAGMSPASWAAFRVIGGG